MVRVPEGQRRVRTARCERGLLFCAVVALSLLLPVTARAAAYEDRVIEWALETNGLVLEPSPDGKRIEGIVVARQEIVSDTDPYPKIANLPHVLSRDEVVRREVLLSEGEVYDPLRAAETERVLLTLGIFSIARVVPAQGSTPESVRLVVVTKDIWSLRLNTAYNLIGNLLQFFQFRPTEANLLGRGKKLSLDFQLRLDTLTLGQIYTDPRVFGTKLQFSESAAIILNRDTRATEGSTGSVILSRPLVTLRDRWSYGVSGSWTVSTARRYRGANVDTFAGEDGASRIPFIYEARTWSTQAAATRSYGTYWKNNLSGGLGAYDGRFLIPDYLGLSDGDTEYYRRTRLPRTERAGYLLGRWRSFEADFQVLRNASSFALSERYQVGHSVYTELRYAPGLGGTAQYAEGLISGRYRWRIGNSLTSVLATATTRLWMRESDFAIRGSQFVNRRYAFEVMEITPPVGPGRFVLRALLDFKEYDLNGLPLYLGGGNGLRGIVPEALIGQKMLMGNVEYRTLPVDIFTVHVGGVLFYDVGTAFDGDRPQFAQTVGVGLRFLVPQLDVEPLRIDYGRALAGPAATGLDNLSSSFGQATGYGRAFIADPHD